MDAHDPTPMRSDPPGDRESSEREDARADALRYLHECRRRVNEVAAERLRELAELSKDLSDWVLETNRQLDALATELDLSPPTKAGPPVELTGGAETSAADAAHLVAMQMAVRGADREEVDRYLREVFEIEETSGILDRAFAA